jgi:hypothetical protein
MRNAETRSKQARARRGRDAMAVTAIPDMSVARVADHGVAHARCGIATRSLPSRHHGYASCDCAACSVPGGCGYDLPPSLIIPACDRTISRDNGVVVPFISFVDHGAGIDRRVRSGKTAQLLPRSNGFTILAELEGSRSCPDVAASLHCLIIGAGREPFA